ncbi:MAG: CIA30 family protein [bacterium]
MRTEPDHHIIVEFGDESSASWQPINDGVMGGLSESRLRITADHTGVFAGSVSLENNGGFASVRASLNETDLSSFHGLAIRTRGDGKRYRLRLRTDNRFDGIAYQAKFDTTRGEWETVEIPFDEFVPTYRGRTLNDVPPLNAGKICQIGFMVADKQEGCFRLEIKWVCAYRASHAHGR